MRALAMAASRSGRGGISRRWKRHKGIRSPQATKRNVERNSPTPGVERRETRVVVAMAAPPRVSLRSAPGYTQKLHRSSAPDDALLPREELADVAAMAPKQQQRDRDHRPR